MNRLFTGRNYLQRACLLALVLSYFALPSAAFSLSSIQYVAYVKANNNTKLAVLKIKQDFVYVVQEDTLFDYITVRDVTDKQVVLYDGRKKEQVSLPFERQEKNHVFGTGKP